MVWFDAHFDAQIDATHFFFQPRLLRMERLAYRPALRVQRKERKKQALACQPFASLPASPELTSQPYDLPACLQAPRVCRSGPALAYQS